uniref:Cytochrome P450 n=1 Tax=Croton stellatopilosus TaxID=431156 RepID=A0A3G2CK51_9ROSI|nr:cytochrome P450 [Croton stellatopilosus]
MSPFAFAIVLVLLGSLALFFFNLRLISLASSQKHKNGQKLPPGPSGLPIIGSLHILGNLPHHTLYNLAKIHGPIMYMRLGYVPTIIVSSARAAKLFLKTHDVVFGTRPKLQSSHYLSYGTKGIAFTGYGPYWRSTKKLATVNLLCASKIESFAPIRKEELGIYVETLKRAAAAREIVNFSLGVGKMIENIACRVVFGIVNDSEFRLKDLLKEALYLGGVFNIADFIPFLAPFDPQGLTKRMKACNKALDKTFERIIDEHEKDANREKKQQSDFIDVLLSLMDQPMMPTNDGALTSIDRTNVKAILLDMIIGSFDSSAATIEWTFAALLRYPRVMKCLQDELQNVVGMNNIVEEKHLSMLPYLDMIIKETFRLHPVGPLLIPRESMEDVTVDGYYIPKKVNSYSEYLGNWTRS